MTQEMTGAVRRSGSVELFVEHARSVNAAFALHGDADTDAVSEICSRLDGIALGSSWPQPGWCR